MTKYKSYKDVVEPNFFSNWGDLWYPFIANRLLLRPASLVTWLTPNMVSVTSFLMYLLAAIYIVMGGGWAIAAAILLPVSYILDCLDGQLARYTGKTTIIGDYLDKTLDVMKIFIINAGMSIAAYQATDNSLYLFLGLVSCFGFLFRYYIKLETMFSAVNKDKDYLDKSRARRHALYESLTKEKNSPKTATQKVRWFWFRNRSLLALDEAEHVTFAALAALVGAPEVWLWVFAIGQSAIALTRLFERGWQIVKAPETLTYPLRK